jgi:hypothetical protein
LFGFRNIAVNRAQATTILWSTYPSGFKPGYSRRKGLDPSSNGSGGSILSAACRPATFLNYINSSPFHSKGSMCAQGASAGSGAIGYSMAWYGAASYLKNVELIVGPVFSEIDQGCANPNAATPTICAAGTSYCSLATSPGATT